MRYNKILIPVLLSVFLIIPLLSFAADADTGQFQKANQLYEDGKYPEALTIYLELEKSIPHWTLFYNMGNCYYKLGNYVSAKIYYLRALRLKPFDAAIEKNIGIVDMHFADKIEVEAPDFLSKVALRIETGLHMNVVSIILLVAVALFNFYLFMLILKGRSRFRLYAISFSLVFTILIGVYHGYRTDKQGRRDVAVIVDPESRLRSGPGENNTVLFKVNPGLKVKVVEKSRGWVQVSASSQVAGWIEEERLERI